MPFAAMVPAVVTSDSSAVSIPNSCGVSIRAASVQNRKPVAAVSPDVKMSASESVATPPSE